ncbi:MAG: zinc-dependent metalloprotease [Oligoflexales bacterium]
MAFWNAGKLWPSWNLSLYLAIVLQLIISCGSSPEMNVDSHLNWSQSRPNNPNYAYLEEKDLEDTFYLGMSVTATDGFNSNALNMMVQPIAVKLFLEEQKKLKVKSQSNDGTLETLLSFDVKRQQNYWEIDFASSGNDMEFNQLVQSVGGIHTVMDQKGKWISQKPPKVLAIAQDPDTVVIDMRYTVEQVMLETDSLGQTRMIVVSEKVGKVRVRMWLKRLKSAPSFSDTRTVGQGKKINIGYFGSNFMTDPEKEDFIPIQRFAGIDPIEGKKVSFYLKNFPDQYVEVAKKAVTSWNEAFGFEALEAKIAPAHIDVGDPRYMVIKWFDGTDQGLRWAGVAKMITMPDTGAVVGGGIYIQGDTRVDTYKKIHQYSQLAADSVKLSGSLGGLSFISELGENPAIPFLTNIEANFEQYMQDYYLETIAHEIGHVLGLRHNFKGSTQLDTLGHSASVMDYLPRAERSDYIGPGMYDIAAIRWGYFGTTPDFELPFCTDEDLWTVWDCSQGDHGDPVNYVVKGLINSSDFLANSSVPVTEHSIFASVSGVIENAYKMWILRDQMPWDQKLKLEKELPKAYSYLREVKPSLALSSQDQDVAAKNIEIMRYFVNQKEEMLRKEERI